MNQKIVLNWYPDPKLHTKAHVDLIIGEQTWELANGILPIPKPDPGAHYKITLRVSPKELESVKDFLKSEQEKEIFLEKPWNLPFKPHPVSGVLSKAGIKIPRHRTWSASRMMRHLKQEYVTEGIRVEDVLYVRGADLLEPMRSRL